MVGKYINDYQIDEIIDQGGMSTVYLGIHKVLKRRVAIKMLNPILEKNPQYKKRFINEAKLLAKLNHPNIISLFDYVKNDLGTFIITEYVKGQTLDSYVDLVSGPMPETKAVKIIVQILNAVGHMHDKNMIHRDIKPSNIMITSNNEVKLIDLGIAKQLVKNQALVTQGGAKLGTTIFMSPQQVKGKVLDRRTDIYSIGATLFYILTGQYPYDKNLSEYEIYNKIVTQPFPDPHRFYTGVSDKMRDVISHATQNQPLKRFQSCEEFSISLLSSQTKRSKTATISLQTKILDAAEISIKKPVLGNEFWQNMVMLMAAITFTAIIVAGLYFLSKKDERHIIGNNTELLETDSIGANKIETLNYGETVRIIKKPEDGIIKKPWYKVRSLRNEVGYVYEENIEVSHIYYQINMIFGNSAAGKIIPSNYKRALREFYVENRYFDNKSTNWKLFVEKYKKFELNYIAFGYFDKDEEEDFACIIENIQTKEKQLLFFFYNKKTLSVNLNENVKIKTIKSGRQGGRWFLGNTIKRKKSDGVIYEAKKYEYLKTDGILLYKQETNENIIYLYNSDKINVDYFSQTN